MRVLITSLGHNHWLAEALGRVEGLEVSAFHASAVDLSGFSNSPAPANGPCSYALHTAPVWPRRPYPYSLWMRDVASTLRAMQPDLIYHVGEPSELSAAQVMAAAARAYPAARRVVFSFENVAQDWRGFPRRLRGWAERRTLPRLDMVFACTHTAREAWERVGFEPTRIRVVYSGADTGQFHRRDATALRERLGAEGRFLVGYVGRLVHEKGVDVLLEALAQLPEEFMLALVGSGPLEADLARLSEERGLAERVRWLGRVPRESIPAHLSAFDAMVLPSRSIPVWREQFGMALVEAMLCETPVVGSSCGAIPEVIGEAGLVFPEGDAAALADRLRRLADDAALREDLARRGLERARREFTVEAHVRRLVAGFRETLEVSRSRG